MLPLLHRQSRIGRGHAGCSGSGVSCLGQRSDWADEVLESGALGAGLGCVVYSYCSRRVGFFPILSAVVLADAGRHGTADPQSRYPIGPLVLIRAYFPAFHRAAPYSAGLLGLVLDSSQPQSVSTVLHSVTGTRPEDRDIDLSS